ncbi:MAG: trigger factor [Eubacterium sp.]|nr:trigger factor [Eubacterium sp.]
MKKKLCSLLMVVLCLSLLAGCGKNDSKKKSSSNPLEAMKERYANEVTLAEYKGVKYTPAKTEVTDETIQADIDSLVSMGSKTENDTTSIATYGDAVNIDYVGYIDGVAFDGGSTNGSGTQITLGSSGYIDNFDEQVVGHKGGDTFEVKVTFPEDYGNAELAGKPAVFETTFNSIVKTITPEYNDALVAELTEYETTKQYEEEMRKSHEEYNAKVDLETDKTNVISKVIDDSKINEYPKEEMENLIDSMISQIKELADSNGVDFSTLIAYYYGLQTEDELKDYITDYVKNYMKQRMVITALAQAENITVSDEEIAAKKQEIMSQYNLTAESEIANYYSEEDIYYVTAAEKVMEFVYENAVIDDGSSTESTEDTTEVATEATTEAK